MGKLLYPKLSYKIVGVLFKVYKQLGEGLQEKHYQKAIKQCFSKDGIRFLEQVRMDIELDGEFIGRYFLDFLVEDKIILEIKSRSTFLRSDFRQVLAYLNKSKLDLGLLARFGKDGVVTKRILRGLPK